MITLLSISALLNIILMLAVFSRRSDRIHDAAMAEWDRQLLADAWRELDRELAEQRKLTDRLEAAKYQPVNRISRMFPQ